MDSRNEAENDLINEDEDSGSQFFTIPLRRGGSQIAQPLSSPVSTRWPSFFWSYRSVDNAKSDKSGAAIDKDCAEVCCWPFRRKKS